MDRRNQALSLIKRLQEIKQPKILKTISDLDAGMRCIMLFLSENSTGVYASAISENMGVSRARVGVLLKKMENKGLVTKTKSTTDSRIEIISMTDQGKKLISSAFDKVVEDTIKLIDIIGYKELSDFLDTSEKIQRVLEK